MRRSTAILLALGIIVLLAANSADFLFRRPYYEHWDVAANSLSILRAKHFSQLYGPYSRFEFYHPGPAFFYAYALGEWLFHDLLHVVPTPFQGQVLGNLCLVTGFFVAALSLFALRLPERRRWIFACGALVLGILHFGQMQNLPSLYDPVGGATAFLSVWSGHSVVLPFLCLLTAGASVGAGRGRDLPLLVIAGGFLMEHVSEPLFVGPTAVVAYVGLAAYCAARQGASADGGTDQQKAPGRSWLLAAWRAHPRAHLLAIGLLILFVLPMAIDLWWGKESNFASILRQMHERSRDHPRHLSSAFAYFLQYGAYTPYQPGGDHFGRYDLHGFLGYLRVHGLLYASWLLAAVLLLQAPFGYLRARRRRRAGAAIPPGAMDTRRFLGWAALLTVQAVALSLYWGTRQSDRMYYYNSWFNFAIFYFIALVALAVLCTAGTARAEAPDEGGETKVWNGGWLLARWGGIGAVLLTGFLFADRLRIHDKYDSDASLGMHGSLERAITAADANHPSVCKVLFVPDNYWTTAAGVGLQLARAGEPFVVMGRWKNTFGAQHDWRSLNAKVLRNGLTPWYIVPRGTSPGGVAPDAPNFPLRNGCVLVVTPPTLELSAGGSTAEIDFKLGGNATNFLLGEWAVPDAAGTWTQEPWAAVVFHPQVVDGTSVEITVDGEPYLSPAHGLTRQRVRLYFNGTRIDPEQTFTDQETVGFTVPAATWNAAAAKPDAQVSLAFELPDATTPASLDPGNPDSDPRDLAVFVHKLRLEVVP